ncbi:MAG: hypothetical protein ACXWT4_06130 [Methylobacter sp.]
MSDLDKLYIDANAPHMAREHRKTNGYPEGNLVCSCCGANNASNNRQRTAYVDSDNMDILCPSCQKKADEYWDGMWANLY